MTQTERVLAMLRVRGERGLRPEHFLAPTIDGGRPILRVAARVLDLRRQGYEITTSAHDGPTAVYTIHEDTNASPGGHVHVPGGDSAQPAMSGGPPSTTNRADGVGFGGGPERIEGQLRLDAA